ncbi:hypothetical protein LGK97_14100 [Clostridium sp. CS001]|uniref:hypothetical protein n=1 Tax=Clostridium sp. CS001 TaxID=2880648 RepID=UPI001CF28218|nr:hypothetical protein [Clostridium sp. CS001]MCB2290875.1 hypothetical protein [Clostridium sp. CS001]
MLEKINSEIIKNENDILIILYNLLENKYGKWWSNFYFDKEKPIPFLKNIPDENLISYFDRELLKNGNAFDSGCGNLGFYAL